MNLEVFVSGVYRVELQNRHALSRGSVGLLQDNHRFLKITSEMKTLSLVKAQR